MKKSSILEIARLVGPKHSLDPYLILAVCEQESQDLQQSDECDQYARRLENGFFNRYTKPLNYHEVSEVLLATSWGIMQTMGMTLIELNYFPLTDIITISLAIQHYLETPVDQVDCGTRWLRKKIDVDRNVRNGLLRWNGGGNKKYPDEVLARQEKLKGLYP